MILVKPSAVLEAGPTREDAIRTIEAAGRTCYKSEGKSSGTPEGAEEFVRSIIARGHESVLEHVAFTVRFVCDRGVSHELVRHRLAAFCQESTRYVDYAGGKTDGHCQFIVPPWCDFPTGVWEPNGSFRWKNTGALALIDLDCNDPADYMKDLWLSAMINAEAVYQQLRDGGWSPQQARSVLPNSTKTEIVVTANAREWRHIFKLRLSKAAHPQMREVMGMAWAALVERAPALFGSLATAEKGRL